MSHDGHDVDLHLQELHKALMRTLEYIFAKVKESVAQFCKEVFARNVAGPVAIQELLEQELAMCILDFPQQAQNVYRTARSLCAVDKTTTPLHLDDIGDKLVQAASAKTADESSELATTLVKPMIITIRAKLSTLPGHLRTLVTIMRLQEASGSDSILRKFGIWEAVANFESSVARSMEHVIDVVQRLVATAEHHGKTHEAALAPYLASTGDF